jgi:hypothetical protein
MIWSTLVVLGHVFGRVIGAIWNGLHRERA